MQRRAEALCVIVPRLHTYLTFRSLCHSEPSEGTRRSLLLHVCCQTLTDTYAGLPVVQTEGRSAL